MAIVYFPRSASIYTRYTDAGSMVVQTIGVSPNSVFFFDTASHLDAISSSTTDAISASYSITTSYVKALEQDLIPTTDNIYNIGTSSLTFQQLWANDIYGTASNAISSSHALRSDTSSHALYAESSSATPIVTASVYDITASWANMSPATTLGTGSTYYVTASRAITSSFSIGLNEIIYLTRSLAGDSGSVTTVGYFTPGIADCTFLLTLTTDVGFNQAKSYFVTIPLGFDSFGAYDIVQSYRVVEPLLGSTGIQPFSTDDVELDIAPGYQNSNHLIRVRKNAGSTATRVRIGIFNLSPTSSFSFVPTDTTTTANRPTNSWPSAFVRMEAGSTYGTAYNRMSVSGSMEVLGGMTGSLFGTSSWADWAVNGGTELDTGSLYHITSSWAEWASNGGTELDTGSLYHITSSHSISSSYAVTASYEIILEESASYAASSSHAGYAVSASQAITASYVATASAIITGVTSSFANSSSYALVYRKITQITKTLSATIGNYVDIGNIVPAGSVWGGTSIRMVVSYTNPVDYGSGLSETYELIYYGQSDGTIKYDVRPTISGCRRNYGVSWKVGMTGAFGIMYLYLIRDDNNGGTPTVTVTLYDSNPDGATFTPTTATGTWTNNPSYDLPGNSISDKSDVGVTIYGGLNVTSSYPLRYGGNTYLKPVGITSSYGLFGTSSNASWAVSASQAVSASWAPAAGLTPGSTQTITSSWANEAVDYYNIKRVRRTTGTAANSYVTLGTWTANAPGGGDGIQLMVAIAQEASGSIYATGQYQLYYICAPNGTDGDQNFMCNPLFMNNPTGWSDSFRLRAKINWNVLTLYVVRNAGGGTARNLVATMWNFSGPAATYTDSTATGTWTENQVWTLDGNALTMQRGDVYVHGSMYITGSTSIRIGGNTYDSAPSLTCNNVYGTSSWAVSSSQAVSASWAPAGAAPTYTSSLWGTASWANSASWAPGSSPGTTLETGSTYYITSSWGITSSYVESASFATETITSSYSLTSSYASNAGVLSSPSSYTLINTGSFSDGTASITLSLDVPEQLYNLSNTVSWSLNFTHSNTFPAAGKVADVALTINNTATMTSSLVFPSTWISVGGGWPTIITASKHAVLALKVYDTGLILGSWGQQT